MNYITVGFYFAIGVVGAVLACIFAVAILGVIIEVIKEKENE